MHEVVLDGRSLSVGALAAIAAGARLALHPDARARVAASAQSWEAAGAPAILQRKWSWLAGTPVAGGALGDVGRAFLQGHCAGMGDPLPGAEVRAALAARISVLAVGASGVRPEVLDWLIAALNLGFVPVVPSQGPVGAAGSAILAHAICALCGWNGEVVIRGELRPAADAADELPPPILTEKEALAVINGATYTAGAGALACARAASLLRAAEAACALSFEALVADRDCLDPLAHAARGHAGGEAVAARLRALTEGSELVVPRGDPDPFSIRCAPSVLGAARDALAYATAVIERELVGACDNPLVLPGHGVVECGNFHGGPIALVLDHVKAAMVQVASIAERRVYRLTYGQLSGLPSFLLPGSGVESGLMLAQYTAASLVSEAKGLAMPASVDSIPTVQHQEDHVSMGPIAARSALEVVDICADVVAIELLCAAQGLDFRLAGEQVGAEGAMVQVPPRRAGEGTAAIFGAVRRHVPRWTSDRVLHPDLRALGVAVRVGDFG